LPVGTLTDEELQQREIDRQVWREEQAWQAEERRLERERQEAEAIALAEREAAIIAEQARERAREC